MAIMRRAVLFMALPSIVVGFFSAQWLVRDAEAYTSSAAITTPFESNATECVRSNRSLELTGAMQDAVAEALWLPASAQFPETVDRITELENCRYVVRSWVEAKNGFGYSVRTPFAVEFQYTDDGLIVYGTRIGSPQYIERLQFAAAQ
ncbi:MAG: hypothetical protein AAF950_17055 [Pseudomonadota bacterium]